MFKKSWFCAPIGWRPNCCAVSLQDEWPERPSAITEGDLVLESVDFRVALAELYARTGLQRPLGTASR